MHPLGNEDCILNYWKQEAEEWVRELDAHKCKFSKRGTND